MECIKVLTDKDFGLDIIEFNNPKVRYGARGIVFNDNGEIAILNKRKKNEYKLVGGGIENNEEPSIAFEREVLEETGCKIKIDNLLGIIKEEKSQGNFKQTSYVFSAHVIEDTKQFNFTEKEIAEGSQLLWLKFDDAMEKVKNCEDKLLPSPYKDDNVYHTKFIVRRDYEILKYYKEKYIK